MVNQPSTTDRLPPTTLAAVEGKKLQHGVHFSSKDLLLLMVGVAIIFALAGPFLRDFSSAAIYRVAIGALLMALGGWAAAYFHIRAVRNHHTIVGEGLLVPAKLSSSRVKDYRITMLEWAQPWWTLVELFGTVAAMLYHLMSDSDYLSAIYLPLWGAGLANIHFDQEFRHRNKVLLLGKSQLYVPDLRGSTGHLRWSDVKLRFTSQGTLHVRFLYATPIRIAEVDSEHADKLKSYFDTHGIKWSRYRHESLAFTRTWN